MKELLGPMVTTTDYFDAVSLLSINLGNLCVTASSAASCAQPPATPPTDQTRPMTRSRAGVTTEPSGRIRSLLQFTRSLRGDSHRAVGGSFGESHDRATPSFTAATPAQACRWDIRTTMMRRDQNEVDVRFIRLLFRSPVEELIAYRWAKRLAGLLGQKAMELRPDTTLSELLTWAALAGVDSMDFVVVFEPELGMEFANFLDFSDHTTFREMVEHYGRQCIETS
jgi:hypothetical protein